MDFLLKQFIRRNTIYRKKEASGRDLVVYCGHTPHEWCPDAKGFAGSEEAIIYLTRELAKFGWDITIYNNCGHKPVFDQGVTYRPSWEFNPRDHQDVVVLWRATKPLDWDIDARKIVVDMHDFMSPKMFTDRLRLPKFAKIFVKSQFQRSFYSNVPDNKIVVIPNGLDFTLLEGEEPRNPHLLINTSSADRSMDVLPGLFKEVKRRVPQARLQWAYGWGLFERFNAGRPERLHWMKQVQREMDDAGIESLGHLTQSEVAGLYRRAAILAYPTEFAENDSISIKKAQACGCVPVTTDVGGLAEGVQFGIKIPAKGSDTWNRPGRFHFGIEGETTQRLWIDAIVDLLTNPGKRAALSANGTVWARRFAWSHIAAQWHKILRD